MGFTTKLDYSNNRQIKQHIETLTALSGGTTFGTSFANLTKGANTSTSGITEDLSGGVSTFSGNNTTTIFNWFDSRMSIGEPSISAITNDIDSQDVLPIFQPISSIVIDGNVINTSFTGITFNIVPMDFIDLGSGNYSGSVGSTYCNILSASTAEFTGRTIWVDVSGITRTEKLIVTNNPQVGYVLTCNDTEGMGTWAPISGSSIGPDVFVTGGTYNAGTAIFTNNTGGTFNVNGFSTGGSSYWSAGTGTNAITTLNGGNIASNDYCYAEGSGTTASGFVNHAEGFGSIASGQISHAEGNSTQAIGPYSHSQGIQTIASGEASHAEGRVTIAGGNWSHAGGVNSIASGQTSFVHGDNSRVNGNNSIVLGRNITGSTADTTYVDNLNIKSVPTGTPINNLGIDANGRVIIGSAGGSGATSYWSAGTGTNAIATLNGNNIASGDYSIATGSGTSANGFASFATGRNSIAAGYAAHAEGLDTQANASGSHSEGSFSIANGVASHAEGAYNIASGNRSHAEGSGTTSFGDSSHSEGSATLAQGDFSHAEGFLTTASGSASHAEGGQTYSIGFRSHAEGFTTIASGHNSHAEGSFSQSNGTSSHAEGHQTQSNGDYSHAQGERTIANGLYSHAQGWCSQAIGEGSFASGGRYSFAFSGGVANGNCSFVHGERSEANGIYTIILGRNITGNTADTTYVDNLNIKTVGSGPGTIDLGVNASGVVVNQASDRILKENINTIENPLDKVMNLRGVTYNWIDRVNGGDDLRLGFIAQEVQEVLPELITNNGDYLGVQYKDVPALLVEAIKELVSGNTKYSKTYLETQTILAEDNNIELNYNGTIETSVGGGIKIIRGEEESTNLSLDENGNWISNVNIFSKGFVIPEYSPTSTQDNIGIIGNIVQDDDYIYIKTKGGWKRTLKLEEF